MKKITVLFGGSERSVHTRALLTSFYEKLNPEDDLTEFSAYSLYPKPCNGCNYCGNKGGKCRYNDLDALWQSISGCDMLVIASPVYHLSFPGPLKTVLDRAQPYFFNPIPGLRPAILLATGGSPNSSGEIMRKQLNYLLPNLGFELKEVIIESDTDRK